MMTRTSLRLQTIFEETEDLEIHSRFEVYVVEGGLGIFPSSRAYRKGKPRNFRVPINFLKSHSLYTYRERDRNFLKSRKPFPENDVIGHLPENGGGGAVRKFWI